MFCSETTQEIDDGGFRIAPLTDFFMLKNLVGSKQDIH